MDILHVNEGEGGNGNQFGDGVASRFQKNEVVSLQRLGVRQGAENSFLKLLEKAILGDRNVDRNEFKRGGERAGHGAHILEHHVDDELEAASRKRHVNRVERGIVDARLTDEWKRQNRLCSSCCTE